MEVGVVSGPDGPTLHGCMRLQNTDDESRVMTQTCTAMSDLKGAVMHAWSKLASFPGAEEGEERECLVHMVKACKFFSQIPKSSSSCSALSIL